MDNGVSDIHGTLSISIKPILYWLNVVLYVVQSWKDIDSFTLIRISEVCYKNQMITGYRDNIIFIQGRWFLASAE
nr:hypothetical protein [Providencia sp. wls1949]